MAITRKTLISAVVGISVAFSGLAAHADTTLLNVSYDPTSMPSLPIIGKRKPVKS